MRHRHRIDFIFPETQKNVYIYFLCMLCFVSVSFFIVIFDRYNRYYCCMYGIIDGEDKFIAFVFFFLFIFVKGNVLFIEMIIFSFLLKCRYEHIQ
jgi:hypothetical protein